MPLPFHTAGPSKGPPAATAQPLSRPPHRCSPQALLSGRIAAAKAAWCCKGHTPLPSLLSRPHSWCQPTPHDLTTAHARVQKPLSLSKTCPFPRGCNYDVVCRIHEPGPSSGIAPSPGTCPGIHRSIVLCAAFSSSHSSHRYHPIPISSQCTDVAGAMQPSCWQYAHQRWPKLCRPLVTHSCHTHLPTALDGPDHTPRSATLQPTPRCNEVTYHRLTAKPVVETSYASQVLGCPVLHMHTAAVHPQGQARHSTGISSHIYTRAPPASILPSPLSTHAHKCDTAYLAHCTNSRGHVPGGHQPLPEPAPQHCPACLPPQVPYWPLQPRTTTHSITPASTLRGQLPRQQHLHLYAKHPSSHSFLSYVLASPHCPPTCTPPDTCAAHATQRMHRSLRRSPPATPTPTVLHTATFKHISMALDMPQPQHMAASRDMHAASRQLKLLYRPKSRAEPARHHKHQSGCAPGRLLPLHSTKQPQHVGLHARTEQARSTPHTTHDARPVQWRRRA